MKTQRIDSTFHYYIKPQAHPILSAFCTELTGITQEMVENGPLGGKSFQEVMKLHRAWLLQCGLINEQDQPIVPFAYLSCGDWDLKTALPINCSYWKMSVPQYMKQWINIKVSHPRCLLLCHLSLTIKTHFSACTKANARGMAGMLSHLGLELEGKHHSGIADCHNILKIVMHLQNKFDIVWQAPSQENTMMAGDWTCPTCNDHNFNRNATCRQCGGKRPQGSNTNSPLGSSGSVSARPPIEPKPGDWVCTCGFNNFARNAQCKKCGIPKKVGEGSTASFAHSSAGGPPPKPGDWPCKGCGYNNFARNQSCKRCNGPK